VRLDVVVVDNKGKQITDLTADDFEVFQDSKKQEITSVRYISQEIPLSSRKAIVSPGSETSITTPKLKREDVRRTIVFLVNDRSMLFEDVYRARMALRKYINEQMQPGDLISIFKTSRGTATLQAFTSDKQELVARTENIQWSPTWSTNFDFDKDFRKEWSDYWDNRNLGLDSEARIISAAFDRI
jgi:VWFA-related protein